MSKLDDAISNLITKTPRSLLVIVILSSALALIVSQNPLSDGCEVEVSNFEREVRGYLDGYKTSQKKIQFAKIRYAKDQCVEGNSQGSCEDYFKALKRIADATRVISPKCYQKLKESNQGLVAALSSGVKIMALAAWGEKPPEGISQRTGWLTEGDIYGFCRAKNALVLLTSLDQYKSLRSSVYREFPDRWPENMSLEERAKLVRPRALRSSLNAQGSLTEAEVYERSLFSLRCDLYQ